MTLTTRKNIEPGDVATSKRIFESFKRDFELVGGAQAKDGTGVIHDYGAHALHSSESWPRAIWVPSRDQYESPTSLQGQGGNSVKPSYTRVVGFVIYLHGADSDMAEMMASDYAALLHSKLGASVRIADGGPVHEDDGEQATSTLFRDGAAYSLMVGILAPVAPVRNYAALHDVRLYSCAGEEVG